MTVDSQPVISSRKETALRERYLPTANSVSLKERTRSCRDRLSPKPSGRRAGFWPLRGMRDADPQGTTSPRARSDALCVCQRELEKMDSRISMGSQSTEFISTRREVSWLLPPKKNGPTWSGCMDPLINCMFWSMRLEM